MIDEINRIKELTEAEDQIVEDAFTSQHRIMIALVVIAFACGLVLGWANIMMRCNAAGEFALFGDYYVCVHMSHKGVETDASSKQ